MPYLIYAIDHVGQEETRELLRKAHRVHLRSAGKYLLASGALLSDDKLTIIGGVSLLDTESRDEAELFANSDPYSKAGIRREINILYWRKRWWDGNFNSDNSLDSGSSD